MMVVSEELREAFLSYISQHAAVDVTPTWTPTVVTLTRDGYERKGTVEDVKVLIVDTIGFSGAVVVVNGDVMQIQGRLDQENLSCAISEPRTPSVGLPRIY